jgi:hypothetical protein
MLHLLDEDFLVLETLLQDHVLFLLALEVELEQDLVLLKAGILRGLWEEQVR